MINVYHVHKVKKDLVKYNDVFIGRPSVLGNPFPINKYCNRKECLAKYRVYLKTQIAKRTKVYNELRRIQMLEEKEPKKEIRILCFCKPLPCHGDIIKHKLQNRMFF